MTESIIAARKPKLVALSEGRKYFWCRCGRSQGQPFCDGSHKGTGIEPLAFSCEKAGDYLLCACKQTRKQPWCDGSHNNLGDTYELASDEEIRTTAHLPVTPRDAGETGKALLDGGCYVRTVDPATLERSGNLAFCGMIQPGDGAHCLSLYYLEAGEGDPAAMAFPGSHVAAFVLSGRGEIDICGRRFGIAEEQGVYIGPQETFSIRPAGGGEPLRVTVTICPQRELKFREEMPDNFDGNVPQRVFAVDPDRREAMADRFYQVLIDDDIGSSDMTQFVGEVPRSRAAFHRHLYEETITILSGSGCLWTGSGRAEVQPGDVIFLPRREMHSLECTSDEGMRLVGVFFPAGSPAVNY